MNAPEYFEVATGYGSYCPRKELTIGEATDMVTAGITFAREQHIAKLLVDTRKLTGFDTPGIWERFLIGSQCARAAGGAVTVAFVARPEMIDPQRFGLTVARNRGLIGDVFTSPAKALTWLLNGTE